MKTRVCLKYLVHDCGSRHGHKYSKCKKRLCMMMLICIKQHLSKIEAQLMKSVAYQKYA